MVLLNGLGHYLQGTEHYQLFSDMKNELEKKDTMVACNIDVKTLLVIYTHKCN